MIISCSFEGIIQQWCDSSFLAKQQKNNNKIYLLVFLDPYESPETFYSLFIELTFYWNFLLN